MKKYKVFSLILGLFILALSFSGCGADSDTMPVMRHIDVADAGLDSNGVTARGTVESVERKTVYTTSGFLVERVYVKDGDTVRAGQVLAVLDIGDLELAIAQQNATLEATRKNTENAVRETRRMLSEAEANLARNTNIHILSAEAALNGAIVNLEITQQNYDNAMRDYLYRSNPHIVAAENALNAIRTELDAMEVTYANVKFLYAYGDVSREEFRQLETGITHLRNQYSDATRSLEIASDQEQRAIQQLRTALQSAVTDRQNAQQLLTAANSAANQEIEMLRSSVIVAELASNLEPMEIAIQLMERQLEDSVITSPIDGTVTAVFATEGAVGMGGLFIVEDTENLRIITSVREYEITKIEPGMDVVIQADATGTTEHEGVIRRISPSANINSHIVEFEVEVAILSENTGLRIGMNTRIIVDSE